MKKVFLLLATWKEGKDSFAKDLSKIKGALTPFQLREVFTHMVYINMHLKDRPIFYSEFNEKGEYHINAQVPNMALLIDEKDIVISHGGGTNKKSLGMG